MSDRKQIAEELGKLLADSYTLYLKTHNYHWNVTGPMFHTLHTLFEEQYTELATAVDDVAERIRTLGYKAPGSYTEFSKLSDVKEETGSPKAEEMVKNLAADHETVSQQAHRIVKLAGEVGDEGSVALASARIEVHEKAAWMLNAHLE